MMGKHELQKTPGSFPKHLDSWVTGPLLEAGCTSDSSGWKMISSSYFQETTRFAWLPVSFCTRKMQI